MICEVDARTLARADGVGGLLGGSSEEREALQVEAFTAAAVAAGLIWGCRMRGI